MTERLKSPEPLRVIAYDADPAVYVTDVKDPLVLFGRLVHHMLLFDEVVLTDSSVVTNEHLPKVLPGPQFQELLRQGVLRVALRSDKSLVDVANSFDRRDALQWISSLNNSLEHHSTSVLPYAFDDVAERYTNRIDEFVNLHRGRDWPAMIGGDSRIAEETAKEYRRQMDWIIDAALVRKGDGPHNRRYFHVWEPRYYRPEELSGLGPLDPFVRSRVESSVATPYYLTVPDHLRANGVAITRWLSQQVGAAAVASQRLSQPSPSEVEEAARRAWQLGPGPVPGGLLHHNVAWLLNPTDDDYKLLGRLVNDPDQLMRLREIGPCHDRGAEGERIDNFGLDALFKLNDALLNIAREANVAHHLDKHLIQLDSLVQFHVREDTFLMRVKPTQTVAEIVQHYAEQRLMSFQIERPDEMYSRMNSDPPPARSTDASTEAPNAVDKVYAELSTKPKNQ